jgi:hypothetical protein
VLSAPRAPVVVLEAAPPSRGWAAALLRAAAYALALTVFAAGAVLHYLAARVWCSLVAPAGAAARAAAARTGGAVVRAGGVALAPVTLSAALGAALARCALHGALLALDASLLGLRLSRQTLRYLASGGAAEPPPLLRAALRAARAALEEPDAVALRGALARGPTAAILAIRKAAGRAVDVAFAPMLSAIDLAAAVLRYMCVRRGAAQRDVAAETHARVRPRARAPGAAAAAAPSSRRRSRQRRPSRRRRRRARRAWCRAAHAAPPWTAAPAASRTRRRTRAAPAEAPARRLRALRWTPRARCGAGCPA